MINKEILSSQGSLPHSPDVLKKMIQEQPYAGQDGIRLIFLPPRMTPDNALDFCYVYRQIRDNRYETVLIIEPDRAGDDETRKIPILPGQMVGTELGSLDADDKLRDDLCDEEDDFFIRSHTDFSHLGFFDHVTMLQLVTGNFKVLGMQLTEESPPIVNELVFVLNEILSAKNSLVVFCCELPARQAVSFEQLAAAIREGNNTRMLNLIYSGESHINGAGIFLAGFRYARFREREIRFRPLFEDNPEANMISGYAGFPDHSS